MKYYKINIYNILKKIIILLFNLLIKKKSLNQKKLILNPFGIKFNYKLILNITKEKLILKEKKELLDLISSRVGENITFVKSIYIRNKLNFGNQLTLVKNIIFYCQILGCKKIILYKNNKCFIKNKIVKPLFF